MFSAPKNLSLFLYVKSFTILYGYLNSPFTGSDSQIADCFFGIDLFIGRRLYGRPFYHNGNYSLLGLQEQIVEGFVRDIVYHTEFVDEYSFGVTLRFVHEPQLFKITFATHNLNLKVMLR